jgi:hypothetical protein
MLNTSLTLLMFISIRSLDVFGCIFGMAELKVSLPFNISVLKSGEMITITCAHLALKMTNLGI